MNTSHADSRRFFPMSAPWARAGLCVGIGLAASLTLAQPRAWADGAPTAPDSSRVAEDIPRILTFGLAPIDVKNQKIEFNAGAYQDSGGAVVGSAGLKIRKLYAVNPDKNGYGSGSPVGNVDLGVDARMDYNFKDQAIQRLELKGPNAGIGFQTIGYYYDSDNDTPTGSGKLNMFQIAGVLVADRSLGTMIAGAKGSALIPTVSGEQGFSINGVEMRVFGAIDPASGTIGYIASGTPGSQFVPSSTAGNTVIAYTPSANAGFALSLGRKIGEISYEAGLDAVVSGRYQADWIEGYQTAAFSKNIGSGTKLTVSGSAEYGSRDDANEGHGRSYTRYMGRAGLAF